MIKLKGLSKEEVKSIIPYNAILVGYRGSIAHGMYVPNKHPNSIDDKDIMSIYVAPATHYFGLKKVKETQEKMLNEWDVVNYELIKFIGLLLKGNPNVLCMLWNDDKYTIYKDEWGTKLIDNKDIFVSKAVYHSFAGYAWGQFHRMTHYKFEGYMGEKRKELVNKIGYDSKNAAHLIRLLKMCVEFMKEGILYVERTLDATMLLEIKNGEWPLEKVKEEAKRWFELSEEAYLNSKLPNKPDYERANILCMEIIRGLT